MSATNSNETMAVAIAATALNPGEIHVATLITGDGSRREHVILLPDQPEGELTWQAAMDWAKSVGGELPDRVEGALLFAHHRDQFEKDWYWTREQHAADSAYAWSQYFLTGSQHYSRKSYELRARAVRRVAI